MQVSRRQSISGPYQPCSGCGNLSFALLSVARTRLTGECAACGFRRTDPMPPLSKRILYLDQFVISELAKVLDTTAKSHARLKNDGFWCDFFKALTRVVRLQLMACPSSLHHYEESSVSDDPSYGSLRDVYQHFAAGCSFESSETIIRRQLSGLFEAWLDGTPAKAVPGIDRGEVIDGNLSEWEEPYRIDVRFARHRADVEARREQRRKSDEALQRLAIGWSQSSRTFEETRDAEARAFGPAYLKAYWRWMAALMSSAPSNPLEMFPPPAGILVEGLRFHLGHRGVSEEEMFARIAQFLCSPYPLESPYAQITSALFAGLARRFRNGQRRMPKGSTFTDVRAIGSLLPYCDAIFVDKEMASLLDEEPLRSEFAVYGTRILSLRDRSGVLEYLREVERAASAEHIALVKRMYGENWLAPWFGMINGERNRRESELG